MYYTAGGRTYRVQASARHGADAHENGIDIRDAAPRRRGQVEDNAADQARHDEIDIVQRQKVKWRECRHDGPAKLGSPAARWTLCISNGMSIQGIEDQMPLTDQHCMDLHTGTGYRAESFLRPATCAGSRRNLPPSSGRARVGAQPDTTNH